MIEILRNNENLIRQLRFSGMKIKELASYFNVTYSSMAHFLTTHQITLNGKDKITDELKNQIISLYLDDISYASIAKQLHVDKNLVRYILESNDVKIKSYSEAHRKYTLNESYFDSIDNQNKAYILGMLYADGNMVYSNHYEIRLKLQDRDIDVLEKIKQEMGINKPLYFTDMSSHGNCKDQYSLHIDSQHICDSLLKYGITPNKTFKVKFPSFLSYDLIRHFIRGYLDGDGCIFTSDDGRWYTVSFTGTEHLLKGIQNYFFNELNIKGCVLDGRCSRDVIKVLVINGRLQTKKILDHIYFDANLYMNRKYNHYTDIYCNVDTGKSLIA